MNLQSFFFDLVTPWPQKERSTGSPTQRGWIFKINLNLAPNLCFRSSEIRRLRFRRWPGSSFPVPAVRRTSIGLPSWRTRRRTWRRRRLHRRRCRRRRQSRCCLWNLSKQLKNLVGFLPIFKQKWPLCLMCLRNILLLMSHFCLSSTYGLYCVLEGYFH